MERDAKIHSYVNGNYTVDIYSDGTKTRTTEHDNFLPDFPESIDIKITDYCDLGCRFCHEMSTTIGKHSDLAMLLTILHKLPIGIELAIGGGIRLPV